MIFVKLKIKGCNAITLWPFVFYKEDSERMRRHEKIHGAQEREVGLIKYPFIYYSEYRKNLKLYLDEFGYYKATNKNTKRRLKKFAKDKAYRNISFEREAYTNENNIDYLKTRNPFSWRNYLNQK